MSQPLWQPSAERMAQSRMQHFIYYINDHYQLALNDYSALYQWSITHSADFWLAVWEFCQVIGTPPTQVMITSDQMKNTQWFLNARLNFAENLLRRRDEHLAIIFASERGDYRMMTYADLYVEVARLATHLRKMGVGVGDRVAAMMPNMPETVIAMLATTSIGAIWSSCSPDFGLEGLVDRFGQIEPKILFAVEGHAYKGKTFDHLEKIRDLQQHLPSVIQTIIVPYIQSQPNIKSIHHSTLYQDCLAQDHDDFYFEQLPFEHPVYILYSSGTTGKPKCMVHGAGGTLLQHLKELVLHTDLHPQHRIFFYTTCSWMMWNWFISSLAVGAAIVLFDGAPFHPTQNVLFDLIDKADINIFGVGATFLESAEKFALVPKKTHALSRLRTILTTGSPLLPESFDYVYQKIISNVCLSSISGGSDIISCFALGNPLLPVYRGEIQCIGLGMAVKIFNDVGKSVVGEKGELVCTQPFPSMPVYFWNDQDGEKYHQAYFTKFPGVWTHGDYAEITAHGGLIIYGRSDATINTRGVRIGTAEIYQQVEKIPDVLDCLAVGQDWQGDVRVILFVILRENISLTEDLRKKIKDSIRKNASPHHVPEKIIQVPDLPRTKNNKLVELAVKNAIENKPIKNLNSLENPQCLDYFRNIEELKHS
jgi:acetoacetyl-CoA synthetase